MPLKINGATSGSITLAAPATGSDVNLTLPTTALATESYVDTRVPGGAWTTYTPTWTNLTVGNGTVSARYTQIGKTVISVVKVLYGSTSSISGAGTVTFTLPVTSINYSGGDVMPIGNATMHDTGAALFWGSVLWLSTTTASVYPFGAASTYVNLSSSITSTVPMTWAANDSLNMVFYYEAA